MSLLSALVLASALMLAGCSRPQHDFPLVQKYRLKAGDLFYFRPDDSQFVAIERSGSLALAVAPGPRIRAYAHDTRIAVGRPVGEGIEVHNFVENIGAQQVLSLTPDGRMLAGGDRFGAVTLWDLATGSVLQQWKESGPLLSVAFSPNATMLAVGLEKVTTSMDSVRVRDLGDNTLRRSLRGDADVTALAWMPGGERLLAAGHSNGSVLLVEPFSAAAPRSLQSSAVSVSGLDFHPEGMVLAAAYADKRVMLWNVSTGKAIFIFEPDTPSDPLLARGIERIAFDPRGNRLAAAYADGDVRIWDTSALSKRAHK